MHEHLAIMISKEKYPLEHDDNTFKDNEPSDPVTYSWDTTGNKEDYVLKCMEMEAEHNQQKQDYQQYLGVTKCIHHEFMNCMDMM